MPYPNFTPTLEISEKGKAITISGPLEDEDDTDDELLHTRVFANVAQGPANGTPPPSGDDEPDAAKAGEATFPPDADEWSFKTRVMNGVAFQEGWAYASGTAVKAEKDGSLGSYYWARWVYLQHKH